MNPAAWRKKNDMTLAEVARLLGGGLALSSVQRYERGEREVPNSVALAYERVSDRAVTGEDLAKARRDFLRVPDRRVTDRRTKQRRVSKTA